MPWSPPWSLPASLTRPITRPLARAAGATGADDRVRLEVRDTPAGRVAHATLDRPRKYNGLDLPMLHALAAVPRRIAADPTIRAVVLSGAGPAFCAGLDFAAVGGAGPVATGLAFAKLPGQRTNLFQRACWAWRELPVPVIALLHGHCFGGGLQLALAADFRIATPGCELSVMEAKWGLVPDMTGSVTLREVVGMDVAKRLAMTAEIVDGRRALELGLVTEVADDPAAAADVLLAQLLTRSPDALAATKQLLQSTWTHGPRRAFWTETLLQARLMRGANFRLARAAAMAERAPEFVSRHLR